MTCLPLVLPAVLVVLVLQPASCSESYRLAELARENQYKLGKAIDDLAVRLYRTLAANSTENVFFSPFSLAAAFGMLFYGARGDTAEELRTVLGYARADIPDGAVHDAFSDLLGSMLKDDSASAPYTLTAANALLLDEEMDLVSGYRSEVQRLYRAAVRDVDFAGQGMGVVLEVNAWVREQTHGKIEKLVEELSPDSAMVLLNAVYFKGIWSTEFQPEMTELGKFYNKGLESEARDVPLMHMTANLFYSSGAGYQLLMLPYKGGDVSMFVLLPDQREGLARLERSLTSESLRHMFQSVYQTNVSVTIPKFKVEFSRELSGDLQTLGAGLIFDAGRANFTGMTPSGHVSVGQVLHKAVVEVNEEGSEAAAVTGAFVPYWVLPFMDLKPDFVADHPFLFIIRDNQSGAILFMGRIENL